MVGLNEVLDLFLRLDVHLANWSVVLGVWTYVILFVVVFCETGLVVTPFLPGDSLLFACGALAALPASALGVGTVIAVLIVAAVLGDATNYAVGKWLSDRLEARPPRWLNMDHVARAQRFYEHHGAKAIVLARFAPILRTFAPFVAGVARMRYPRFAFYNVAGAITWVCTFVLLGFWFGNMPAVRRHFQLVVAAIIVLSLAPVVIELVRARRAAIRAAR